jgi:glycosyl transferase family 2/alpha 1,4-glycosyltransferase
MRLAAVTTVRSECDIIESFVRHNAAFFDRLYILDHRSADATPAILRQLAEERLPLALSRENYGIFYQAPTMTHLIKRAFDDHPWDFIVPLDCDEFVRMANRSELETVLAGLDEASIGLSDIATYVPTVKDDANEKDVLRRIVHCAKTIPEVSRAIGKVIIPGAVVRQSGFSLNEGHHGVCIDGKPVRERRLDALSLAHFPVRSIDQFTLRTILYRLAWASRADYNPSWGWHYKTFFKQLAIKPAISAADLTAAALLYADIYIQPEPAPHRKVLAYEPVVPAYERLRCTDMAEVAVLPPILDMMDFLLGELRTVRMASPARAIPAAFMADAPRLAEDRPMRATARHFVRHRFQSFWHGGALSPYELCCLKSFVDHGCEVDLYTYDANLRVPAGVRICDAGEIAGKDEVFVYEAEGFGKGSPSAFSNFFRYKLLAEKGGWWIDTDVLCLSDRIPAVSEFFARQDDESVNGAILYFEPGHPVMAQCLAETVKRGRDVKWGDTGPVLLTRVLQECGCLERAIPASVCYPVHYTRALDVLRQSSAAVLLPKIESSLFLHLWNSNFVHAGVEKNCRPPDGSLLRILMDRHPVEGWRGEHDERTLEHAFTLQAGIHALQSQLQAASARWRSSSRCRCRRVGGSPSHCARRAGVSARCARSAGVSSGGGLRVLRHWLG